MRARSLAPLRQLAAPRPLAVRPLQARLLHSSRPALATENPSNPLEDAEIAAFREKMKDYPGAVDAIQKLSNVLQKKGLDLTKQPTMVQLAKLAVDKEFRAAVTVMTGEIQKAGIEPKNLIKLVQESSKVSQTVAAKMKKAAAVEAETQKQVEQLIKEEQSKPSS
ncbi:hypothetical protein IAT38_005759 [Cryptococcus sp. DSM 104549]